MIVSAKVQTAYTSYNRKQGVAEPPSYNIGGATAPPAPLVPMQGVIQGGGGGKGGYPPLTQVSPP